MASKRERVLGAVAGAAVPWLMQTAQINHKAEIQAKRDEKLQKLADSKLAETRKYNESQASKRAAAAAAKAEHGEDFKIAMQRYKDQDDLADEKKPFEFFLQDQKAMRASGNLDGLASQMRNNPPPAKDDGGKGLLASVQDAVSRGVRSAEELMDDLTGNPLDPKALEAKGGTGGRSGREPRPLSAGMPVEGPMPPEGQPGRTQRQFDSNQQSRTLEEIQADIVEQGRARKRAVSQGSIYQDTVGYGFDLPDHEKEVYLDSIIEQELAVNPDTSQDEIYKAILEKDTPRAKMLHSIVDGRLYPENNTNRRRSRR